MRLAIVGSRHIEDVHAAADAVIAALNRHKPCIVVSGGADGIDMMAEAAADGRGIRKLILRPALPQWEPHGYKERNQRIAQSCDALVAIISRKSQTRGAQWTHDYAKKLGVSTELILID